MVEKYEFDSARCEQDWKPYRGNEALRAIMSAKKHGEEWQNDDWFHIGASEEREEAQERFEAQGQAATEEDHDSGGDTEASDAEEEAGGVWISSPASGV